jgi:hypothetical protein
VALSVIAYSVSVPVMVVPDGVSDAAEPDGVGDAAALHAASVSTRPANAAAKVR